MEQHAVIPYFIRLHAEDYGHFTTACDELTQERLWSDVPGGVPIGNILCHVAEMEAFWIDWGLAGEPYGRDRQREFDRRNDLAPVELKERLVVRRDKTVDTVTNLPDAQWSAEREFHGDMHTGITILAWHLRHLGLHRGHVQAHRRWIERG